MIPKVWFLTPESVFFFVGGLRQMEVDSSFPGRDLKIILSRNKSLLDFFSKRVSGYVYTN